MKQEVWIRMQPLAVLTALDLLLPDYVDQKDWEVSRRKKLAARSRGKISANTDMTRSLKRVAGGLLVAWALAMMAPGPVDVWFAKRGATTGAMLGSVFGPWGMIVGGAIGAAVFVIAYNLFALAVFALGTWMVVTG
jgi:hypothetical protein